MWVPAFLLGDYRTVRPKARRFVKDLLAGKGAGELHMVQTEVTAGLLVISPASAFRTGVNFQMYAPMTSAGESFLPNELRLRLFDEFVASCWGTLCLLDQGSTGLVEFDESRSRALVKSVLQCWALYCREGDRFGTSLYGPTVLWRVPSMLQVQLCRLGVPAADVQAPLPDNDLGAFLSGYPEKFGKMLSEVHAESAGGSR
jgi:hypothetical protein